MGLLLPVPRDRMGRVWLAYVVITLLVLTAEADFPSTNRFRPLMSNVDLSLAL